jgi:hypothetical protein
MGRKAPDSAKGLSSKRLHARIFGILLLSFSLCKSEPSLNTNLICTNCGVECRVFSSSAGIIKTESPYRSGAECEWIIAPASQKSQQNFSMNLWLSFFETKQDRDFVDIFSCQDPLCSTARIPVVLNLSGIHTGANITVVVPKALLLRLSTSHDGNNNALSRGFSMQWNTLETERRSSFLEEDGMVNTSSDSSKQEYPSAGNATNRRSVAWVSCM